MNIISGVRISFSPLFFVFLLFFFCFSCKKENLVQDYVSKITPKGQSNSIPSVKKKSGEFPDLYKKWGFVGLKVTTCQQNPARIVVSHVFENTPASIMKVQPGFQILRINGIAVKSERQFDQIVRETNIGSRLSLFFFYNGRNLEENLVVITYPQDEQYFIWAMRHKRAGRWKLATWYFDKLQERFPVSEFIAKISEEFKK